MAESENEIQAALLARTVVEWGLAPTEEVEAGLRQWRQAVAAAGGEGARAADAPAAAGAAGLGEWLRARGVLTAGQLRRVLQTVQKRDAAVSITGYEILERLGAGAAATVYLARQLRLDRLVALKVMHRRPGADARAAQKLAAEARAAATLNHPNIVQAYDVGQIGDIQYFAMEYVRGTTVAQALARQKRYGQAEALWIISQITEALKHAHAKGLVHCDVKPQNIIITNDGVAKLADLGLARRAYGEGGAPGRAGTPFGTPHYNSPEQVRGAPIDHRTDQYSLGCTFYQMVTGRVPFEGRSPGDVMRQHLFANPAPPEQINPDLSDSVAAIIATMMAKDPAQRYVSADELGQDLLAAATGAPLVHARHALPLDRLMSVEEQGKPIRFHKWPLLGNKLFWLLALSLLLNAVLLIALIAR